MLHQYISMATATALTLSLLTGCSSTTTIATQESTTTTDGAAVVQTLSTSASSGTQIALTVEDSFSTKDYEVGYISSTTTAITLEDGGSSVQGDGATVSGNTITITAGGTYLLSGSLSDGQIVLDCEEENIQLVLDGVSISNSSTAAIYVVAAKNTYITTASGSINTITATLVEDATAETNVDGAIFSHDDLTLNGQGSLSISAVSGNGVVCKDDLKITSGDYTITADSHGLEANDSIRIAGGTFDMTVLKDGLHCENEEDSEAGYIYIVNGSFNIDAQGDGIDSSSQVQIEDGTFNITAGGGYDATSDTTATTNVQGGMPTGGRDQGMGQTDMQMDTTTDMNGQMGGQMSGQMGAMPGMMEGNTEMPIDESFAVQSPDQTTGMMGGQMGGQAAGMMPGQMTGQMGTATMPEATEMPEMPEMTEVPEMTDRQQNTQIGGMSGQMGTTTTTEDDGVASTKGIKAGTYLLLMGGDYNIDSLDDALHSNLDLEIWGGTYQLNTSDDAIHAEINTFIGGGTITVTSCYEGIEGEAIEIAGGTINIKSNDDGINAARGDSSSGAVDILISGGSIFIDCDYTGDGFDSNGTILMTGGSVLIYGTTATTDTTLDYGSSSTITGGTFIATGSAGQTLQNFGEDSTQASILVQLSGFTTGDVILTDSNGNVVAQTTPTKTYQAVIISSPDIQVGETYTLTAGDYTETIVMESLIYGEGNEHSMGGMTGGTTMQGGMSGNMGGGMQGGMGGGR